MAKKCILLSFLFISYSALLGFTQEIETVVVKGTVMEVAEDSSYVVVDDTRILTDEDFILDCYLEQGDEVEIITSKTESGLEAVSCEYVFEEEEIDEEGFLEEPEITDIEGLETAIPEEE